LTGSLRQQFRRHLGGDAEEGGNLYGGHGLWRFRAVFVADTYPLRVVIFYLFYGRRAIPSGVITNGLGYATVVTDH
jgi:hypothetical protein